MNLGLEGKKAIVCASSRGLGEACAMALAREGVEVVVNGRDLERVETTASAIRNETGANVLAVAADLCSDEGRARLVAVCPEPDILVTNNADPHRAVSRTGITRRGLRHWNRTCWLPHC
jgi:3-oxoacyl-[acyl-carrier protein] reductase